MTRLHVRRAVTTAGLVGPIAIEFDGDRITAIDDAPAAGARDVTIVPGFVDLQVNGVDDIDVASATGDDWTRLGDLLAQQGTTTWCPTLVTMPLDSYAAPLAEISAAATGGVGPAIAGAHLEGPFLGGAPGAHPPDLIRAIDLDWLAALPPIVRIMTLAPEQSDALKAIELLVARGVLVSLGHSAADAATAHATAAAGAELVTHLFNGMGPFAQRAPGLVGAALVDPTLSASLIVDLVHVHPDAIELAFRAKGPRHVVFVTDSVAWRAQRIGRIEIALRDGAPRLPDGTLAGSALRMNRAVGNAVSACNVALVDAIGAASTNPARLLGLTDRGTIEKGRRADLVLLDDNHDVVETWIGGRVAFSAA